MASVRSAVGLVKLLSLGPKSVRASAQLRCAVFAKGVRIIDCIYLLSRAVPCHVGGELRVPANHD
ncbi:hypothetical protein EGR_05778 [Echinococcus granulosus]|uniref:Uncharacterized protein n=1 Tax=Echinococcus granulosus TaxID=6210 RepID=W6V014_ECHGR|nr:hypothetical protein EGR_05778 [Echinococcus granulosus]EUB59294.1 hypothetical protein EGR_05778 [Echinococcus granulosus]